MTENSAFDQYNHYSAPLEPQPEQKHHDPPPRRVRYRRRSSVTLYNLASYQPQHEEQRQEQPAPVVSPPESTAVIPTPPRQRYKRRSSVTQYNLATYQPQADPEIPPPAHQEQPSTASHSYSREIYQQQQQQILLRSQDIVKTPQYPRRSSVDPHNLEDAFVQSNCIKSPPLENAEDGTTTAASNNNKHVVCQDDDEATLGSSAQDGCSTCHRDIRRKASLLGREPSLQDIFAEQQQQHQGRRCSVGAQELVTNLNSVASLSAFETNHQSFPTRGCNGATTANFATRRSSVAGGASASKNDFHQRAASFQLPKPERRLSLQLSYDGLSDSLMNSGDDLATNYFTDSGDMATDLTTQSFMNSGDMVADFETTSQSSMSFMAHLSGQSTFEGSFSSLAAGGAVGISGVFGA